MRRSVLVLAAALFALSACKQEAPRPAGSDPDAKPGLSVSNGVLILPAVKGNPGAALFDVTNAGDTPATLAAAYVDGADKAEMHETRDGRMGPLAPVEIKPGETVKFARGGKHVMAFGLADALRPGGATEMTLTFADGDKLSTQLAIESPAGAMARMGHGD